MSEVKAPPITPKMKMAFGLGSTAEAIVLTTTSSFLLIFYNQVQGLNPAHVGVALSVGLMVNAVFDPLVGSWSDRTRSRWGRRHPFLFASILPGALCYLRIVQPAGGPERRRAAGLADLLQRGPDAGDDPVPHPAPRARRRDVRRLSRAHQHHELQHLLPVDGRHGGLAAVVRLVLQADARLPERRLDPSRWRPFALAISGVIVVCLFVSSFITKARIPFLRQAAEGAPSFGFMEWMRDMGARSPTGITSYCSLSSCSYR
jgi:GPH family glycoside/pentoside/hexuronide:cation symporter